MNDAGGLRSSVFRTLTDEEKERFWSNIDIRSDDECWLWQGNRQVKDGRGTIRFRGTRFVASRVALALQDDHYPTADKFACHKCDNPPCCNPGHLWWGSNSENIVDCFKKGRLNNNPNWRTGELNPKAKLKATDIPLIRVDQRTMRAIADEYGVRPSAIAAIKQGRSWRHI